LTEHAIRRQFSPERLEIEIASLHEGVEEEDIVEALGTLRVPSLPLLFIETAAAICERVTLAFGKEELAATAHGQVAQVLKDRFDSRSLAAAVRHYQRARQLLSQENPHYKFALIGEGMARCRLAELGTRPLKNARRAVQV